MTMTTNRYAELVQVEQDPSLILEPLVATSIAFNPNVASVHNQEGSARGGVRIPIVVEDAVASWTAEGEEIAPSEVAIDELEITPSKVAGLIPLSRELAEDSSPSASALVGTSLARALVFKIDAAFLGDLPAPAPSGLASVESPVVVDAPLDNLDPLLEAKAQIAINGGQASAVIAHPTDALALAQLKDSDGSNRALLADLRTVADLPLIQTQHATQGTVWIVDANAVHVVLREDVEVTASGHAMFTSDRIAVRGTARVGFGFPYPNRVARFTITAA